MIVKKKETQMNVREGYSLKLTTTQVSADLTLVLTAILADALTEGLELKASVDWVIKEGSPQSSGS